MAVAYPLKIRQRIVVLLATGSSPSEAARVVVDEFEIPVSRQMVARHDPRRAGSVLNDDLTALFWSTHEQYLVELEHVSIAHRVVRMTRLDGLYDDAAAVGDRKTQIAALEQARKEMIDLVASDPDEGSADV